MCFPWGKTINLLILQKQLWNTLPILKNPRILAGIIDSNRRILSPLWLELIEEGRRDGSIQTEYAKELSELLPLLSVWMMPAVFPADEAQMQRKLIFIKEMFAAMGLPVFDDDIVNLVKRVFPEMEQA